MSDVSVRELYQLVNAVLTRDLISGASIGGSDEDGQHNFTKSMDLVTAPILFVAGEVDAVHPAVLYRDGYEQVSSEIKDYKCFARYGHMDILHGLEVGQTVLPYVANWLERIGSEGKPQ
jgi:hypothetical protein